MQNENQIRKVLFNEVSFVIAVLGVFIGVFLFLTEPTKEIEKNIALIQKDISVINTNHLTHLQNYAEEIKNMKATDAILADKLNEIAITLAEIKADLKTKQ